MMARRRLKVMSECVVPSIVSAFVALVGPTAFSIVFSGGAYDGVRDESVEAAAAERYWPFLSKTLRAMALVGLTELTALVFVVLGLSLLHRLASKRMRPRRRWLLHLSCAFFVVTTYFLFVADRHPGLFVTALSSWPFAYRLVVLARFVFPAVGTAAFFGYGMAIAKGPTRVRVPVIFGLFAMTCGAFAVRHVRVNHVHVAHRESEGAEALEDEKARAHAIEIAKKGDPPEKPKPARVTKGKRASAVRPSVLWIAVDSLRPDKIDPTHTPHISKLLSESVYFPNTFVEVPRTGPSWVSALTSMSPLTHGVETMFPDANAARLSKIALPANLAARGYRTGVFSDYAGEFFGKVDVGFQQQSIPRVELREISGQLLLGNAPLVMAHVGMLYASGVAMRDGLGEPLGTLVRGLTSFTQPSALGDDLVAWIDRDKKMPFFGLVFYSQPHFPYASNRPYYRRWHAGGSNGSIAFARDVTNETPITAAADIAQIDGLYRGALAESDDAIGALLARLEQSGDLDDAIVILTADHGEGLYDCPTCVGHGDNLTGLSTLRTPLAIRLPKKRYPKASAPQVVETRVSQMDIYPSLLELLGHPPNAIHEGVTLFSPVGGLRLPTEERTFFAETGEWLWTTPAVPKDRLDYPPITGLARIEGGKIVIDAKFLPVIRSAKQRAAIRWPWKLVYSPGKQRVVYRLYREDQDPNDEHDLADREPAIRDDLERELRRDVLRHSEMMSVRDYFVSRPPPPEEE